MSSQMLTGRPLPEEVIQLSLKLSEKSIEPEKALAGYFSDSLDVVKAQSKYLAVARGAKAVDQTITADKIFEEVPILKEPNVLWPNVLHDSSGHLVLHWIAQTINVVFVRQSDYYEVAMWDSRSMLAEPSPISQEEFVEKLVSVFKVMSSMGEKTPVRWKEIFSERAKEAKQQILQSEEASFNEIVSPKAR